MRDYSIPALAQIADRASLADVVFSRAASQPQAVALRRRSDDGTWHDVTAGAFRDEVAALAKGLVAAGVEPGERIGLMSRTRYEWTLIDYAIWAAGAVTVPVYETSSAEQVEWILGDSGARAVFAETGRARGASSAACATACPACARSGRSTAWPRSPRAGPRVSDEQLAGAAGGAGRR